MRANDESMYWMTNKEWFTINQEKKCYELTSLAPERAKKSFKLWSKPQRMTIKQLVRTIKATFM